MRCTNHCPHQKKYRCYHPNARAGELTCPLAGITDKCVYCGHSTSHRTRWLITVDDGRKPNTPNRWRLVGYACDGHVDKAQEIANKTLSCVVCGGTGYVWDMPNETETPCRVCEFRKRNKQLSEVS